ncbi:MAG: hypothetical protein GTO18_09665 [Anaerolineales bacterium]|nr:hypothetical protein [Anaerolineales bacterium]
MNWLICRFNLNGGGTCINPTAETIFKTADIVVNIGPKDRHDHGCAAINIDIMSTVTAFFGAHGTSVYFDD